jgi:hypothetical protein
MARRRRARSEPGTPLGGYLKDTLQRVDKLCLSTIHHMVPLSMRLDQMLCALFSPEVRRLASEAFGRLQVSSGYATNFFLRHSPPTSMIRVTYISFEKCSLAPPHEDQASADWSQLPGLSEQLDQIEAIYRDWAAVRHVVSWMNSKATLGAIRYYWPTLLSLIPSEAKERFSAEVPTNFKEPDGIGQMLPLLKASAATVGSALLMPDIDPPGEYQFTLSFQERMFQMNGVDYTRQGQTLAVKA